MAQQAVKKQAETTVPTTRSPRVGRGKPPEKWDYSRWRMSFNDPDKFMGFMRGYPNAEGVTLFAYRLVPDIDMTLIGLKETNIQKGGYTDLGLYSPEAIGEKFGRGKYNIRVTDSNRPDGQREVVKSCKYELNDPELKPPVYDVRTLKLGSSDNIDEVNRLLTMGVLVRDGSGVPRLRTGAEGAPASVSDPSGSNGHHNGATPASNGDMLDRATFSAVLMELIKRGSTDPNTAVANALNLANTLRPPMPAVDIEAVIERVAARLGRAGVDPFADSLSTYERVEGFINKFRGPAGPAVVVEGDSAAAWAPHLPGIIAQARAMIPELVGAFRIIRAEYSTGAQQNGGPQQPMTMDQRIEQVARMGFDQMNAGVSGFDFAVYVCNFHPGGREVFMFLDTNGGAAGLMALVAMNPGTRPLVSDPARRQQIESFLVDFFSFDASVPSSSLPAGEADADTAAAADASPSR